MARYDLAEQGAATALPVVASSDAPAKVKRTADYVCSGSDDQDTINQALTDTQGSGLGGAWLTGGLFFQSGPILIHRAQTLRGIGMLTELRAVTGFQDAMVKNAGNGENMITIADLLVNGSFSAVHGIALINGSDDFSQSGTGGTRPGTSPDSVHWVHHVFVRAPGTSGFPGHGIWMGTTDGTTRNSRGNKIHNSRVIVATGNAFHLDASSDAYMLDCTATTREGSGGYGYRVGGGSAKLVQCKTAYTWDHGFNITSSRAQLTGCSAQDSGGHGYNILGDAHLTGCQADSNGRIQSGGGDGYYIGASDVMIEGCRALDRSQSPQRQRHGFNYGTGTNVYVTGQAYNNTGNKFNNSGSFQVSSNYARIAGDGSIYSWGG